MRKTLPPSLGGGGLSFKLAPKTVPKTPNGVASLGDDVNSAATVMMTESTVTPMQ